MPRKCTPSRTLETQPFRPIATNSSHSDPLAKAVSDTPLLAERKPRENSTNNPNSKWGLKNGNITIKSSSPPPWIFFNLRQSNQRARDGETSATVPLAAPYYLQLTDATIQPRI
ncbi:hypothetical protein HYDPIDRAFT_26234 [Hydnomerulius pinastri MD-312]|nr:hypothetical protein HYDPIDRAFT_26234 [Hydnomerulius pinastri MD-312]